MRESRASVGFCTRFIERNWYNIIVLHLLVHEVLPRCVYPFGTGVGFSMPNGVVIHFSFPRSKEKVGGHGAKNHV